MGLFLIVLLMSTVAARRCDRSDDDSSWFWKAGAGLAAGVLAVVAAPVVVPFVGFGAGGISAGPVPAGAMFRTATTGATGALTLAQAAVVGGGTAAGVYKVLSTKDSDHTDDE